MHISPIKKWLGIDVLERQNAARAEEILVLTARINALAITQPEPELKSKPATKPHRANWRTFRAALERETEIDQQP